MTENYVSLTGRAGRDPESKYLSSGSMVVNFSLATEKRFKGADGQWTGTPEWHNIVAFGKLAEIINELVAKGSLVSVRGRIEYQTWEKDGVKHYKTVIIVNQCFVMSRGNTSTGEESQEVPEDATEATDKDDLPF